MEDVIRVCKSTLYSFRVDFSPLFFLTGTYRGAASYYGVIICMVFNNKAVSSDSSSSSHQFICNVLPQLHFDLMLI